MRWLILFFWKNSYWGIPQEEVEAMSKPGYINRFGRGIDLDYWDQRIFGAPSAGEPCLLPVVILEASTLLLIALFQLLV